MENLILNFLFVRQIRAFVRSCVFCGMIICNGRQDLLVVPNKHRVTVTLSYSYANSPLRTSAIFLEYFVTSPLAPITVNLAVTPFKSCDAFNVGMEVNWERPNAQFRICISGSDVDDAAMRRKPLTVEK